MKKRVFFTILMKSGILLALLLAACKTTPIPPPPQAETPTPTATISPTETPTPTATVPEGDGTGFAGFGLNCEEKPLEAAALALETNPFFIEGQVILTGHSQAIEQVRDSLSSAGITLTEVTVCQFTFPEQLRPPERAGQEVKKNPSPEAEQAAFPFYDRATGNFTLPAGTDLSMNLYSFQAADYTLQQILEAVRQTPAAQEGLVYADPNYLTGHLANTPCGNPFSVEGSPFSVEGSPFSVEGSPYGGASEAHADAFWNQWAFSAINLQPPATREKEQNGKVVRVGIFDTSPYTLTGTFSVFTETVIQPNLVLNVHHPFRLQTLEVSSTISNSINVSDHGLFVASLVHAMALDSEIHLYQVLDEKGCGDVYHLNVGMLEFIATGLGPKGARQPGVMNLSLGIRKPRQLPSDSEQQNNSPAILKNFGEAIQQAYEMIRDESSIESLEFVVSLADRAGNIVVAAAGNDSVTGSILLPMELPAAYPSVLGVSATNRDASPACYSNEGDVAAPGGAAVPDIASQLDPAGNPVPICRPMTSACSPTDTTGQCEYGVVGLFSHSTTHYAYWVGTSFATPLVSGLAAAYYQTGSPASVLAQIMNMNRLHPIPDSRFGAGLIQAP